MVLEPEASAAVDADVRAGAGSATPPIRRRFEIVLPDGVRIVARAETSPTAVAAVVAALRARC